MSRTQNSKLRAQNYGRILIARLDRIGDVVLSTPAIKAVRDAYPEGHIAVMVRPYARQVVEGDPDVNEVIIYDKDGREKSPAGNIRFVLGLKNRRFDAAIALHPTSRTHLLLYLAGIPVRVGYDRKSGFLLTRKMPHTKQFGLKHEIDYALDVVRYFGVEPVSRILKMPVSAEAQRTAAKMLSGGGVKEEDLLISVNPGASCPSKRWPAERFAEAASKLAKKYGAKIAVVCSDGDKPFGDKVAALSGPECVNLSGRTTVAQLAAVLKRSKLFISNDSGPVHIACAVGTPVVAIFGRNDAGLSPRRWGPTGERDIILHKDVGCDICLAHNCRIGFKCLTDISAGEVVAAADGILGLRRG